MRHLMSPLDFSVEELDKLFDLAEDIESYPEKYAHACDGKVLATCFYEPSTRTRLSFESAMIQSGWTGTRLLRCRSTHPLPRVKAYPTPSALSPALPISVPCVIPKKARPW